MVLYRKEIWRSVLAHALGQKPLLRITLILRSKGFFSDIDFMHTE